MATRGCRVRWWKQTRGSRADAPTFCNAARACGRSPRTVCKSDLPPSSAMVDAAAVSKRKAAAGPLGGANGGAGGGTSPHERASAGGLKTHSMTSTVGSCGCTCRRKSPCTVCPYAPSPYCSARPHHLNFVDVRINESSSTENRTPVPKGPKKSALRLLVFQRHSSYSIEHLQNQALRCKNTFCAAPPTTNTTTTTTTTHTHTHTHTRGTRHVCAVQHRQQGPGFIECVLTSDENPARPENPQDSRKKRRYLAKGCESDTYKKRTCD
jgi:hypothetical protein